MTQPRSFRVDVYPDQGIVIVDLSSGRTLSTGSFKAQMQELRMHMAPIEFHRECFTLFCGDMYKLMNGGADSFGQPRAKSFVMTEEESVPSVKRVGVAS